MKKLLLLFALMSCTQTYADSATTQLNHSTEIPADSARITDLEDLIVVGSPKEHIKLRQQALAVSLVSPQEIEDYRIQSLKDLSILVPSLFIPDYGSRITSAIYVRGVGSRINTPSVGLYVDNIPMLDKSGYDFNYNDVDRIDILRGPQATLYGRNAMGGLIRVHTKSPMNYRGDDFRVSMGMYGQYNVSLTHYHRVSKKFAFSVGGFYEYDNGFYKNKYLDKYTDQGSAAGGRFHAVYKPVEAWNLDFNVSYQYSDQMGYAYGAYDKETGETADVSYNDESSYYRNLLNASFNAEYEAPSFILNAATGYQFLKDRMYMDQDFTSAAIYTLEQKQKQHAVSEEITLKSRGQRKWDWLIGAFGFYQNLNTNSPVTFKEEGVRVLLEDNINQYIPAGIQGSMDILNPQLRVDSDFESPVYGLAVFHQSTLNNILVKGLSLTAGLRLDYEKNELTYHSASPMEYAFPASAMGMTLDLGNTLNPVLRGKLSNDYLQLLPKVALTYHFDARNQVYASFSKGYRSGGYNIQMISDLMQNEMKAGLTEQIRTDLHQGMIAAGAPEGVADMVSGMIPTFERMDVKDAMTYKPEYCWNYEVGTHLTLLEGSLWADAALYYMDTRNQQIARFADSGLGRRMVNAGRSESYGAELGIRAKLGENWALNVDYGYTYATFKEHLLQAATDDQEAVDYSGNYVPFIPRHTVNVGLRYDIRCAPWSWFDKAWISGNYTGAGRIYWTEKNDASQKYYNMVNLNFGVTTGIAEITLWARNLLDTKYNTFCFNNSTTQDNFFAQKGKPFQMGVDLRLLF